MGRDQSIKPYCPINSHRSWLPSPSQFQPPLDPWISEAYHPIPKRLPSLRLLPLGFRPPSDLAWLPKRKQKKHGGKTSVRRPSVRGSFCVRTSTNKQSGRLPGCPDDKYRAGNLIISLPVQANGEGNNHFPLSTAYLPFHNSSTGTPHRQDHLHLQASSYFTLVQPISTITLNIHLITYAHYSQSIISHVQAFHCSHPLRLLGRRQRPSYSS